MLKSWLVKKQYVVETATSVADAKQILRDNAFDMVLSDIRMPETDGFTFLSWIKRYDSDIIVILMTGFADIDTAVEAMKLGAADYVSKPIDPELLYTKIASAFNEQQHRLKNKEVLNTFVKPDGPEFREMYLKLDDIIQNNKHLLIIGEAGTGKVSVAKHIYRKGEHSFNSFVTCNSELLYSNGESGSNRNGTGDKSAFMNKFETAKGGVFFLRKVHKLDINLQTELLVLLTKQNKDENYTQIISSTEISKDELKKALIPKLFQILDENCIVLPTLKNKKENILLYAAHFLKYANTELDKNIQTMDEKMQDYLVEYDWPGNIQELKNTVLKAALLTDGDVISADLIPVLFKNYKAEPVAAVNSDKDIVGLRKENYEKAKITEALELAKGNKTMAASILNIDRKTLYNKIKLYKVEVP